MAHKVVVNCRMGNVMEQLLRERGVNQDSHLLAPHDPRLVEAAECAIAHRDDQSWIFLRIASRNLDVAVNEQEGILEMSVVELRGNRYRIEEDSHGREWVLDPDALDRFEWTVIK